MSRGVILFRIHGLSVRFREISTAMCCSGRNVLIYWMTLIRETNAESHSLLTHIKPALLN